MRVLEEEIGQETLFKTLQDFIKNHAKGDAAEWSHIEASVNRVTGKDYHWFFEQWTERKGVPYPRLADVKWEKQGDKYVVAGAITQTGASYRLSLPLSVEHASGITETLLVASGERTEFRIEVPAAPLRLRVDPRGVLLLGVASDEKGDPLLHNFAK